MDLPRKDQVETVGKDSSVQNVEAKSFSPGSNSGKESSTVAIAFIPKASIGERLKFNSSDIPIGVKASSSQPSQEQILLEPYNYILQLPGKQIRIKLATAFNYWLNVPKEKLQIIAEVVQMLHNASLLIDDIEDNSCLRRGIPVAHHIFGVPSTINSGNYVYFLGLQKALTLQHPKVTTVFTEQLLDLHRGQGMDIYWRDSYTCPTQEEYEQMVIKKTGGLFGLAVRLMQLFSDTKSNLRPLMDNLGLYFQVRDDYANLYSEEYEANKSFAEDLTEGKFSFPLIYAIRAHPHDNQVMNILRQRTTDNDVKKYCIRHVRELGALDYTVSYLVQLENKLLSQIEELGGNPHLTGLVHELRKIYQPTDKS